MNPLLFVSGTLLSTVDHPMSRRLAGQADLVGPATFQGRLYQVSWYPGLVDGAEGEVVHGELHRLRDSEGALACLDEFEGVTHGTSSVTDPDDYERVEREVQTEAGRRTSWVYLYRGDWSQLRQVSTGKWDPIR